MTGRMARMELPRPRKGTEPDRLGSQASKGAWDFLLSGSRCGARRADEQRGADGHD
jgi:hypothetical protein